MIEKGDRNNRNIQETRFFIVPEVQMKREKGDEILLKRVQNG